MGESKMDRMESPEIEPIGAEEGEADQLRADLQDAQDLYLRTTADFDNYRKRIEREREGIGASAKRDLLLGIVDLADDFELALGAASAGTGTDKSGLTAGVAAIY